MYQSTDRQVPHILTQRSAVNVRVLLYVNTVLEVVRKQVIAQTSCSLYVEVILMEL